MNKIAGGLLLAPLAVFAVACGPNTSSSANPYTPPPNTPTFATTPVPTLGVPRTVPGHTAAAGPQCHTHFQSGEPLPDPRCTPGSVQSTSVTAVCMSGWASAHREEFSKEEREKAFAKYGVVTTNPAGYGEYDHLIPLELGGSNNSDNLWPEPGKIPNAKDPIENALHEAVCSGRVSLTKAQHDIAQDWVTAATKDIEVHSTPHHTVAPVHHSTPVHTAPMHTTAPATVHHSAPKSAPAQCHPTASSGNCYEPGEFCPKADAGMSGVAGDGKSITCESDGNRHRWEAK